MTRVFRPLRRAPGGMPAPLELAPPRVFAVLSACLALLAAAGGPASAQDDPGEALYRLGERLLEEGKPDQAASRFDEAVRTAPQSPFADDALLALGRISYPVSTTAELGTTGPKKLQAAAELFERVRSQYRGSNSAPAATYRLGLAAMDPVNPKRNLDEAWAHFTAVTQQAPGDPEAIAAAIAAARCDVLQGRPARALAELVKFTALRDAGPRADRLSWELADLYDRSGDPVRAIAELQRLRDERPDSPLAAPALARSTLLWRSKVPAASTGGAAGAGARSGWKPDAAFAQATSAVGLLGPRAVAAGAEGRLFVADEKAGFIVELDAAGKPGARRAFEHVQYLAPPAVPGDELRAASNKALGRPGELAATPAAGEKGEDRVRRIGGIAARDDGGLLVLDSGDSVIYRYGPGMDLRGAVYRSAAGSLAGLAGGPDGEFWTGLEETREVVRLDPSGKETVRVKGPGKGFGEITALAVDAAGSLYVLDGRNHAVFLFDRSGASLGSVDLTPLAELDAESLAVDPSGRILLPDRKGTRIARLG